MTIVTLSITTPRTKTLLRNLLRRQQVGQIYPMQWRTKEELILGGKFPDLVGGKRSGLDDHGYSSVDDNEDYNNGMEEEACRIEYSDSNKVHHVRRQTNFIPGGPKPPPYDGMSATEMVFAKSEFKNVRKKYTDGLRMERLKENNEEYELESFSGRLALVLRPMTDVQKGRLEAVVIFSASST
jgi:hypothetical protein